MMELVDYAAAIAIGIAFPFILVKMLPKYYKKMQIASMCSDIDEIVVTATSEDGSKVTSDNPVYKKCISEQRKAIEKYNNTVWLVIVAASFAAIFLGAYFKIEMLECGLKIGGAMAIMTLLFGIKFEQKNMKEITLALATIASIVFLK
jgi:hypothetical protein